MKFKNPSLPYQEFQKEAYLYFDLYFKDIAESMRTRLFILTLDQVRF